MVVSLCALAFIECVQWLNDWLLVSPRTRIQFDDSPMLVAAATVLVPAIGGLVVGFILTRLTVEKRPLGPPDTILMVQTGSTPPSIRSGLLSSLAAIVSLGSGASVGQYGPMVYLGTLVGSLASKLKLDVPNIQSIAIASGVAAAISTAFNAPIAGLVFAHEVILPALLHPGFCTDNSCSCNRLRCCECDFRAAALVPGRLRWRAVWL